MYDYNEYKALIEEHLLDYIPRIDTKAQMLFESMKYSLTSGGKRLRPVLLLAACDFAGGNIYEALPFACAIEFQLTIKYLEKTLQFSEEMHY